MKLGRKASAAIAVVAMLLLTGCGRQEATSPFPMVPTTASTSTEIAQAIRTPEPTPTSIPTATQAPAVSFSLDEKDISGYTTSVEVEFSPVNFQSSIIDQAPGFTDLSTPMTMKGTLTNTTPGRNASASIEWRVLAGYPADSPACLLADPDSPIASQYKGLRGETAGASCIFDIRRPYLATQTVPVGGSVALTEQYVGTNFDKPLIAEGAVNLVGVPESHAEEIRTALNDPAWYALLSSVDSRPVLCTWGRHLHIIAATPGFTCEPKR